MNILLTGGSGFIGKNICEHFAGKYNLLAPGHRELDLLNEVAVEEFISNNSIDAVIHSAVKPSHRNARDLTNLFYSNTRMYFNLVRQAKKFGKMIVLGSGAIYDTRNNLHKVMEDSYTNWVPADEHGFCKWVCARDIENADNIVELRLFGVFGKYEDYAIRFISNAICKTLFDLPITIRQNRRFDYVFVDDLMPILDYFINNVPKHKAYNITTDSEIELMQLAELVRKVSGKELPIIVGEPGMGLEYSGDNHLLRSELEEIEFTPIGDAIRKLFKWYEDNIDIIEKEYLLFDK